jgi:hypothetical protein
MFLRFIGLSFVVPGVVPSYLPREWFRRSMAIFWRASSRLSPPLCWLQGSPGLSPPPGSLMLLAAGDLLYAFFKGARVRLDPGSLGAAFYIVTAIVPSQLATHTLLIRG